MELAYLARVDSLAGEGVVVGSHLVAGVLPKGGDKVFCVVGPWGIGRWAKSKRFVIRRNLEFLELCAH